MDHFFYSDGQLFCENLPVDRIVDEVGSPAYIYSRATFEHHYEAIARAFAELEPLICYSIKSCGNIHLLRMLAERGAGMDVVSGGELYRAQQAEVDPGKIVYAGVGKTDAEIEQALRAGIGWFNIESEQEFETIAGFIFNRAGRLVEEGETIEYDGLDIYVERVENTRIMKARLVKTEAYEQPSETEVPEDEA